MKVKLVLIISVFLFCIPFFVSAQTAKEGLLYFECENGWEFSDEKVSVNYYLDNYRTIDGEYHISSPQLYIVIENKSSDFVYLDLGKCFIIRNGNPEPLWANTKTYDTKGKSTSGSVNVGTIANVLGVGGVVGDLANGISIGGGKNNSKTVETSSPRVEPLPPMSKKEIRIILPKENCFDKVISDYFRYGFNDSYFYWKTKLLKGESVKINKENSPIIFSSLINYSLTESCDSSRSIINNFYANKLTGLFRNKKDFEILGYNRSHKEKCIRIYLKKPLNK